MTSSLLSAERARQLFSYDPLTGGLTWKVFKGNRAFPGKPAGSLRKDGYLEVRVDRGLYLVHRLVWLISSGEWPTLLIDHENTIRSDNRLKNLRDTTRGVNQENQRRAHADSATGCLGVSQKREKFRARIRVKGVEVSLGSFASPREAHETYLTAKRSLHVGCTI